MSNVLTIADFIKGKREEKGFSQRQLADLCNISNSELWQIETGKRKKVQPSILQAIAPHIGVTYEELMKIAGYFPDSYEITYIDEEEMPPYYMDALGLLRVSYKDLTEDEFKTMTELMKTYRQTILNAKAKRG